MNAKMNAKMNAETKPCGSCGAPVLWLRHERTGKPAPIDAAPSENGNIAAYPVEGTSEVLGRDAAAAVRQSGLPLHTNHFVTCPAAEVYKKRVGQRDTRPTPPQPQRGQGRREP